MDFSEGLFDDLMNWMIRNSLLLALLALSASLPVFYFTGIHKHRIEDRGAGCTTVAAGAGSVVAGSLHSGLAILQKDRNSAGRWRLGGPVQSVSMDAVKHLPVALKYQDYSIIKLRPGSSEPSELLIPERDFVAAAVEKGRDSWYLAYYDANHDHSVKKSFPYIFPEQLRFRYRIVRLKQLDRWAPKTVFESDAIWHEESAHPWILRYNDASAMLYLLNPMAEQITALDTQSNRMVFQIPSPAGPVDMIVDGGRIFVACPESETIAVLDAGTGRELTPIASGAGVVGLAAIPGGVAALSKYKRRLVLAEYLDEKWHIQTHRIPGIPTAIATDGDTIYIADGMSEKLKVVSAGALRSNFSTEAL